MGLHGTTGGHEVLQNRSSCGFTEVLVISIPTKLGVLGDQDFLPWQHNLVVVSEPAGVEVGAPVVDFVLSVRHVEQSKVLFDGGGARRGVRKDGDVNMVGETGMEVPLIAGLGTVGQLAIETDVVGLAVHPAVPRGEGNGGLLLALQGDSGSRIHDVGLATVSHVGDFHVEDVISGEHAIGGLNVPGVGQRTVNGQDTFQSLVVMAGQNVGLTDGDIHRFNVENHALDVVGFRQFVVVVPRLAHRGVVKDRLHVQTIDTSEELVACDGGHSGFFGVDVGSGVGVHCVLNEGVFREGDVVEADALETVIDTVSTVIVRLEFKVDVHHGTLEGHALGSPLA